MCISRILLGIIATLTITIVNAEEYKMIVSFPAGSQTDAVARLLQNSIEKNTHDHIVVVNLPGADQTIGAIKFKTDPNYDIILSSSSQDIFVPIIKSNPGYSFSDFDNTLYVGTSPSVWVVRNDSEIKTIGDMLKYMPSLVGGYAQSYNTNVLAVTNKYNKQIDIVSYKGGNEVIMDIVNGSLKLGIVAVTPTLIQLVKDGRLRIIGTTYKNDVTIDDIFIQSTTRKMGIHGFNGFIGVDLRPTADSARKEKLKNLLWAAIKDPETIIGLKRLYILPDATDDKEWIDHFYKHYRERVKEFYRLPG